ncbi:Thioredoxin-2 [Porphyridium purpureum]|uniref:Thioredoxin-2 n=1 Tax=Porphyridium purpureum TaxID=35688 RepID=A0A5J4Z3B0_PORPP|nr:Thioredoxin-2 [Porphyridium purpureum]|eukprot:POR8665..scf208_2
MGVIHVKSDEEFRELLKQSSEKLLVVDWFATWCGPCKAVAPALEKMAQSTPDVVFAKVDVDALSGLAKEFEISAMPTFDAFKDGKSVERVRGADVAAVTRMVDNHKFAPAAPLHRDTVTNKQLLTVLRKHQIDTRGYLERSELLALAIEHHLVE